MLNVSMKKRNSKSKFYKMVSIKGHTSIYHLQHKCHLLISKVMSHANILQMAVVISS